MGVGPSPSRLLRHNLIYNSPTLEVRLPYVTGDVPLLRRAVGGPRSRVRYGAPGDVT